VTSDVYVFIYIFATEAIMPGTTIRIREETREALRELVAETGQKLQDVLAAAVEAYRRQRLLDESNRAYEALRRDPEAWREEQEERRAWDQILADGLEPEERAGPR
jgi:hypothetical protein